MSQERSNPAELDHLDLMAYADGEADADIAAQLEALDASADAHEIIAGVAEVGEAMRTYLELEADRAEPALDAMWTKIEGQLDSRAATQAAPERAAPSRPAEARAGLWARFVEWLDETRGHFATAAVAATAAAALVMAIQPAAPNGGTANTDGPDGDPIPVMTAVSTPPEVEQIEVSGGSASVFTLTGDDDDVNAGVIWLDLDPEEQQEGPI